MKEKFDVTGMMCSACQAHVDKAVRKLEGVKEVNVNLLSNSMIVEFDESKVQSNQIVEAVEGAGYGAKLIEQSKPKTNENHSQTEKKDSSKKWMDYSDTINSMKKRLIFSIFFWILLMYVAMHHMFYDALGIPIPSFIKNTLHGNENAFNFGLTQFLLLLPIIYLNRNYFISGFKKLWKRAPNMDSLVAIGSAAAIVYGIYALYKIGYGLGHGDWLLVDSFSKDLYFESSGTILTLVTVRKIFRDKGKR